MTATHSLPEASSAPRWMQKLHYATNPLDYMETSAQRAGDLFNAPVIGQHPVVLFVSHPQALQQLLADQNRQFSAPPNQILQPIVGDRSIFVMAGQRHRRERKLLMPPFHGERMQGYGQLICALAQGSMASQPLHTPFSARERMQEVSLEVILRVVFGLSEGESFRQLKAALVQLTNALQSPLTASLLFFPSWQKDWGPRSPWGRFRALQRQVSTLLQAEIQARRQAIAAGAKSSSVPDNDILSLLIATRDEAGEAMSDAELHDELMTLLLAGHETTATAIAWALYWIHRHPRVRDTLLAELEGLQGADALAIARLPYLTAVCNETLRIYPVAMLTVPREVTEPVTLSGYALQPGARLYGCIYLTHHRPDLYPDPKQFRPERFLERQFTPYEFLPFGGGVRRCIGEALALFEMKLVVATLMTGYTLALADDTPEQPKRRGVTLAPGNGVRLVVQGRR